VTLLPQALGNPQHIDAETLPPDDLIADLMQLPMMAVAERDGDLIADLHADRARLRKAQMMRVGCLTAADKTRLRGNEFQMGLVT
jgi:hypothetical protein